MKKDLIRMSPIDPCRSPLEPPAFVLGRKYFTASRPGLETHLHLSRVEGYRLFYQLLGGSLLLSPEAHRSPRIGLPTDKMEPQLHRLLLSITNSEGKHVRAPQVVFMLIGADGGQRMIQGSSCAEGHSLIFEWDDPRGLRVETEVVADGRFLTDHFVLEIKGVLN